MLKNMCPCMCPDTLGQWEEPDQSEQEPALLGPASGGGVCWQGRGVRWEEEGCFGEEEEERGVARGRR